MNNEDLIRGLQDMHDRMRDGFGSAEPSKALLREAIEGLSAPAAAQANEDAERLTLNDWCSEAGKFRPLVSAIIDWYEAQGIGEAYEQAEIVTLLLRETVKRDTMRLNDLEAARHFHRLVAWSEDLQCWQTPGCFEHSTFREALDEVLTGYRASQSAIDAARAQPQGDAA